jgi:hypothetical protein
MGCNSRQDWTDVLSQIQIAHNPANQGCAFEACALILLAEHLSCLSSQPTRMARRAVGGIGDKDIADRCRPCRYGDAWRRPRNRADHGQALPSTPDPHS